MAVYILNFSGYVLDKNINLMPGAAWSPNSDEAVVYKSFNAAKKVVLDMPGNVAIYRVVSPRVECTNFNHGKYYIPNTSHLCIDRFVREETTMGR